MKAIILAGLIAVSNLNAMATAKKSAIAVSYKSIRSFEAEFGNVADVYWTNAKNNMLKASFTQDGEALSAFFDRSGEYVGTTVALVPDAIPYKLRQNVAANYAQHTIVEAFELRTNDGVSIYIKLQKDGISILLKGNTNGYFTTVSEKNPY